MTFPLSFTVLGTLDLVQQWVTFFAWLSKPKQSPVCFLENEGSWSWSWSWRRLPYPWQRQVIGFLQIFLQLPHPKLPSKSLLNLTEITDNAPYLTSVHSTVWSIRCEGNRRGRPRRNTGSGGTDKGSSPQSSNDESSNSPDQAEIIALFRRIQSSIAKDGGSRSIKKRRSDNNKERNAAELVLDVLRQSRKQIDENRGIPKERSVPKTKRETEDFSPTADVNVTRPPSNFVKKSPIPKPSTGREHIDEVVSEDSDAAIELRKIEEMKVPELREVAKARGIKGYSKLKKGELVELLKG